MIIGVDEAGRGALAGPVVAGAVFDSDILQKQKSVFLHDSKQLTEAQREKAFEWIIKNCDYGVGIVDAEIIDTIGIKKANEQAMNQAVDEVVKKSKKDPEKILVDGRDKFVFPFPSIDIIKGDEKELCIAAGSIVAKVIRDRLMKACHEQYPEYGFDTHKGYGSESHRGLLKLGKHCPIHRISYDPLRTVLTQGKLF